VNRSLYDKEIEFPSDKREHMKKCFLMVKGADENTEGFNRNKELQNQKYISYKQLKRIKNFFDNFIGNHNEPSFILNGGVEIKNWVNNELRRMREYIKNNKTNKMNAGMMNQFLDPHEKKDFTNVRQSQVHSKTVDQYTPSVNENVERIKELITKL
jgi:hypothetical protein